MFNPIITLMLAPVVLTFIITAFRWITVSPYFAVDDSKKEQRKEVLCAVFGRVAQILLFFMGLVVVYYFSESVYALMGIKA